MKGPEMISYMYSPILISFIIFLHLICGTFSLSFILSHHSAFLSYLITFLDLSWLIHQNPMNNASLRSTISPAK